MPTKKNYFACTGYKDAIYAIGGKSIDNLLSKTIEKYSLAYDKWEQLKIHLNYSRVFHSVILIDSRIYIIGGTNQSDCIEWFDIEEENVLSKCYRVVLKGPIYEYNHAIALSIPSDVKNKLVFLNESVNNCSEYADDTSSDGGQDVSSEQSEDQK